jgi:hypothetical protein
MYKRFKQEEIFDKLTFYKHLRLMSETKDLFRLN